MLAELIDGDDRDHAAQRCTPGTGWRGCRYRIVPLLTKLAILVCCTHGRLTIGASGLVLVAYPISGHRARRRGRPALRNILVRRVASAAAPRPQQRALYSTATLPPASARRQGRDDRAGVGRTPASTLAAYRFILFGMLPIRSSPPPATAAPRARRDGGARGQHARRCARFSSSPLTSGSPSPPPWPRCCAADHAVLGATSSAARARLLRVLALVSHTWPVRSQSPTSRSTGCAALG
jgi:hypothetical protein